MLTSHPQLEGQIRTWGMFIGGFLVSAGWIARPDLEVAMYVATAAVPIFGAVWSWWVNRPAALVQAAASTDVVETIKLDPRMDAAFGIERDTAKATMSEPPPERRFE